MNRRGRIIAATLSILLLCFTGIMSYAQSSPPPTKRSRRNAPPIVEPLQVKRYKIIGGVLREVGEQIVADSLKQNPAAILFLSDSLFRSGDSLRFHAERVISDADSTMAVNPGMAVFSDSMRLTAVSMRSVADSLFMEGERLLALLSDTNVIIDSLRSESVEGMRDSLADEQNLSKRELRRLEKNAELTDTTLTRYSPIFRDTLPLSRMTAISFVAPGLSQLHNKQYWKIPVLYGTVGAAVYLGIQQNKCFQRAKSHYNELIFYGYTREDSDMDETQRVMIKYNTRRQLLFGAAIASYIYFIGDGVMNYPGGSTNVKVATTLSTICPGAGQIYNGSYWKAPIVMGAFASMVMMIDWNNRGYQRFSTAYNLKSAGQDDAIESSLRSQGKESLLSLRNAYRRNRDLCIILTGAVYLINLVDAHVDAHMKNYDISDDLNITLQPSITNINTRRAGNTTAMGFSVNLTF